MSILYYIFVISIRNLDGLQQSFLTDISFTYLTPCKFLLVAGLFRVIYIFLIMWAIFKKTYCTHTPGNIHCVKSVQIRSFFLIRIWTLFTETTIVIVWKMTFLERKSLIRDYFMQFDEFGYIMILFDTFWTKYFEIYEVKRRDISLLLLLFFHFFWKQCNKQHITFVSFQLDKQDNFERVRISKWCTVDPSLQPTFN